MRVLNIHGRIYLTVQKEIFHPEIQFKAVFVGGRGRKFEKKQVEVLRIIEAQYNLWYSYIKKVCITLTGNYNLRKK